MPIITIVKYTLLIAIGGVLVMLAQQNSHQMELHNFWSDDVISIPVYLLIFAMFLLGLFTGGLVVLLQKFRGYRVNRQLKQHVKILENELSALKMQGEIIDGQKHD
jgi:uncharacterized integral membrane protein